VFEMPANNLTAVFRAGPNFVSVNERG
jgi:hypothetical protein